MRKYLGPKDIVTRDTIVGRNRRRREMAAFTMSNTPLAYKWTLLERRLGAKEWTIVAVGESYREVVDAFLKLPARACDYAFERRKGVSMRLAHTLAIRKAA